MGQTYIEITKSTNIYGVLFRNAKYQKIVEFESFYFEDINNDYENLYSMIMDGFEKMPKDDIKLELPNDIIWLHFEKITGVSHFQFIHSEKDSSVIAYSVYLTKKQVKKLFNKE